MAITIEKAQREETIASLQRYCAEYMSEDLGNLAAGSLLAYILEEIGPLIYNQAVRDVQERLQTQVMEVDIEMHEDEFQYWRRHSPARKTR